MSNYHSLISIYIYKGIMNYIVGTKDANFNKTRKVRILNYYYSAWVNTYTYTYNYPSIAIVIISSCCSDIYS